MFAPHEAPAAVNEPELNDEPAFNGGEEKA